MASIPNILSVDFLVPYVVHRFDSTRAVRGLQGMPRTLLLIGQVPADAQIAPGVRTRITSEADAVGLCGEGSMLVNMWRGAKSNAALGLPIDVIALTDDGTAQKATGKVVIAVDGDEAPVAGEVMLYIGGVGVRVGVAQGDTAAVIASRLSDAIAKVPSMPVTTAAAADTLTLTCRWGGETGNDLDVRATYYQDDVLPYGVGVTITPMSGGAVNPDISPAIRAMRGYRATEIAMPYTDSPNMRVLEDELNARWDAGNASDGQAMTVVRGTEGTISTWLGPRNSAQVHTLCVTRDLTSPWVTAAMAAAAAESHCTTDPAVPFTGVALNGYVAARHDDDWEIEQRNNLLTAGGSVLETQEDGTANILRMVTNYTHNSTNAPDASQRNLNWIKTLSYYRWYTIYVFATTYRGYKCAEYLPEPIPGQKIMTAELGQEVMLNNYQAFMTAGLMQNMEYYKATLLTEIDGQLGKLKIIDEPVLVTQHYQTEITSQYVAGHV